MKFSTWMIRKQKRKLNSWNIIGELFLRDPIFFETWLNLNGVNVRILFLLRSSNFSSCLNGIPIKKKKKKKKKNGENGQIRGTSLAIIKTIGEIAIDRLRRRTLQHPSDTFLGASAWLVVRVEPREITSLNTSNHRKKGRPKTYETDLNMNYGIRWFVSSARDFSYGNML